MERQYQNAYASLGEERMQEGIPADLSEFVRKRRGRRAETKDDKNADKYWDFRRDDMWVEVPRKIVYKKGRKVYEYVVTKLLIDLAPSSTFNPRVAWESMKTAEREAAREKPEESASAGAGAGVVALKAKDAIIEAQNEARAKKDLLKDTVKIRNMSNNLKNLKDLLPEIRAKRSREILLLEILKKSISEQSTDHCEVYDVLWAIEAMGELTEEVAPQTEESKRPLVFDSLSNVKALLKQARQIRAKETNLTSFQLNEMSSRLPPLSKYNAAGFRLDPWQRQVLEFVDAGKSVVVCAPTSSGKTVLSSYVALIDRRHEATDAANNTTTSSSAVARAAAATDVQDVEVNMEEDEEGVEEDEGESDEEEEEESGPIVESSVAPEALAEHFSLIYDNPRANYLLSIPNAVKATAARFSVEGVQSERVRAMDRMSRLLLRKKFSDGVQRVLFVVPSEPLVWQVAAYFAKLLREEGDTVGRVGLATNMLTYIPEVKFGTVPQIFVGTPVALESALTKPRGLIGRLETKHKSSGVIAPGGFDHFDWAVYDEVHALDGEEGDALQRLIRAMNCKFLALSATVGNAEELRSWFERVKGEQLVGVERIDVLPSDAVLYAPTRRAVEAVEVVEKKEKIDKKKHEKKAGEETVILVRRTVTNPATSERVEDTLNIEKVTLQTTVETLLERVYRALPVNERGAAAESLCLRHASSNQLVSKKDKDVKIETFAAEKDKPKTRIFDLLTVDVTVARKGALPPTLVAAPMLQARFFSPWSTIKELKADIFAQLTADEKEGISPSEVCLTLAPREGVVSVLPVEDDTLLETIMVPSTDSRNFTLALELTWLDIQAIRTLDFQRATVNCVSPLTTVLKLKEKLINKNWPYFVAEGLQLLFRFPVGPVLQVTDSSFEEGSWFITVQAPIDPTLEEEVTAVAEGTVLLVGDDLVRVLKMVSKSSTATDTVYRARVDHFYSMNGSSVHCTASEAIIAADNKQPVLSYIPFFTPKAATSKLLDVTAFYPRIFVETRSLVNLLQHSARFINLQRYVWDGKLKLVSPLAAVSSVRSLQDGILEQCNLSFTSRDSFRLWLQLERLYPTKAVQHLNPNIFFAGDSRITLQRSKEYEDALKHSLKSLAENYPLETQELLYQFRLEDPPKQINLCDLMLALKKEEKLPALVFHLNSFDAIQIFRVLLAALERRQKVAHPYYYTANLEQNAREMAEYESQLKHEEKASKKKDKGGKDEEGGGGGDSGGIEKDTEAEQPTKFDEYEPHPKFTYANLPPLSSKEIIDLSDEMERNDGFKARDFAAMTGAGRGLNKEVLGHALVRGLRRGIGLFINEVSAPSYRRAVQRLASQGKLAIVVSDDSLAFGVNMPFRTCVFCGEMESALTPLMAQQMSGRAGRRGLDTEGNLVYAGATSSFIRELMIGQVANITGEKFPPKYDTMFLQGLLSNRHTGWSRVEQLGGKTLNEHINGTPLGPVSYSLECSRGVCEELGLIERRSVNGIDRYLPVHYWETLSMVWELRFDVPVSVCFGSVINLICEEVAAKTRELLVTGKEESREAKKERLNQYVAFLFSIFIQICDRVEHDPAHSSLPPLQRHPYLADPRKRAIFSKWSNIIRQQQESIPAHLQHLRLPVPVVHDYSIPNSAVDDAVADPNYVLLDSSLLECMMANKQEFIQFGMNDEQKQKLKARIWHAGCILRTVGSALWPRNEYYDVLGDALHQCFRNLYYLNLELVRYHIRLDDVSSVDRELRKEKDGIDMEERPDLSEDPSKNRLVLWKDNENVDNTEYFPVAYATAAVHVKSRFFSSLEEHPSVSGVPVAERAAKAADAYQQIPEAERVAALHGLCSIFADLNSPHDVDLLHLAVHVQVLINSGGLHEAYIKKNLPLYVAKLAATHTGLRKVGAAFFLTHALFPRKLAPIFPKYLLFCNESSVLDEEDIKAWAALGADEALATLPAGSAKYFTPAQVSEVQKSKGMTDLLTYLDLEEEEDDEEGEEEEDDEE